MKERIMAGVLGLGVAAWALVPDDWWDFEAFGLAVARVLFHH